MQDERSAIAEGMVPAVAMDIQSHGHVGSSNQPDKWAFGNCLPKACMDAFSKSVIMDCGFEFGIKTFTSRATCQEEAHR